MVLPMSATALKMRRQDVRKRLTAMELQHKAMFVGDNIEYHMAPQLPFYTTMIGQAITYGPTH